MTPTDPTEHGAGPRPGDPGPPVLQAPGGPLRWTRLVGVVALRVVASTTALLVAYFLVPVRSDGTAVAWVVLIGGIALLAVVTVHQLRRIIISDYPWLRGVEAVAILVPLFLVVFAYVYLWMSKAHPGSFTHHLSRIDGLYFVVTVLTTTGFGDITAKTQTARVVVTLQMVLDLVFIGVVIRLILGASRFGVRRRQGQSVHDPDPPSPSPHS